MVGNRLSSLGGRMWTFENVTAGVACGYHGTAECVNCGELIGERFLCR